jgi:hypothetical protein
MYVGSSHRDSPSDQSFVARIARICRIKLAEGAFVDRADRLGVFVPWRESTESTSLMSIHNLKSVHIAGIDPAESSRH